MSVITVSEVKDLLNITTTADDGAVVDVITRAEAALAGKVGRLEPTVVVEWLPSDGGAVTLTSLPVLSLTAVSGAWAVDMATLTLRRGGVVTGLPAGDWSVTYQAGRTVCPPDLQEAALLLAKHMWEPRRGPNRGTPSTPPPGSAHTWPIRVLELIEPHLLPGFA